MAHSEIYKVPPGFDMGIDHSLEVDGIEVKYHNGHVAQLQEKLILCYNRLSTACKQFRSADAWFRRLGDRFKGVGERANTDVMEDRRFEWLRGLRTCRSATVNTMVEIFQAGAEPVPANYWLDLDAASATGTNILLRRTAIAAVGGQAAVQAFRIAAETSIQEALVMSHSQASIYELVFLVEQNAWVLFEEDYKRNLYLFFEEEDRAANEAAEAAERAVMEAAEAAERAVKEAAEAAERAVKEAAEAAERAEEARAHEQGPSAAAGRRRKEAKLRLNPVLEELKARREKRRRSPPPRG